MIYIGIGFFVMVGIFTVLWLKAEKERREIERHSIEPEDLYALMSSKPDVLLFDVRQPLDLLAEAEMIPGARRVPPKEIEQVSVSVPKDRISSSTAPAPATKPAAT